MLKKRRTGVLKFEGETAPRQRAKTDQISPITADVG